MTNILIGGFMALSLVVQGHVRPSPDASSQPYQGPFTQAPRQGETVSPAPQLLRQVTPAPSNAPERGPCNMPVVRGTAEVDPRFVVPIKRENTDPKIRAIEPQICWDK